MAVAAIPADFRKKPSRFLEWMLALKTLLIGFLLNVLRCGPIPRHVAIIMDGNRRYAKKHGLSQVSSGHLEGAKTLEMILEYGYRLGIKALTVYAFSIENFKRPPEEVDILMALAAEKLQMLSQRSDLIKKYRVRIQILGALHMLPAHVLAAAASAMSSTRHYDSFILNICFPYTSSYEIKSATERAVNLLKCDSPAPCIEPASFDFLLDTWSSPPLDILVRTSGENRLSEFLLWQCCRGNPSTLRPVQIEVLPVLWPEFSFRHLLPIILRFQNRLLGGRRTSSVGYTNMNGVLDWIQTWRSQEQDRSLEQLLTKSGLKSHL